MGLTETLGESMKTFSEELAELADSAITADDEYFVKNLGFIREELRSIAKNGSRSATIFIVQSEDWKPHLYENKTMKVGDLRRISERFEEWLISQKLKVIHYDIVGGDRFDISW